ncbi:hypothetical protein HPG69_000973 [Diceros bicornis minor]|uniref:Uncharacterized protein n=1 Tax=Diceros bicornis minor TaxID=77932 RepID=A0A7J7E5G2_DICBM|nr:hypothetical protein HPG69_000973 [Diceros bicornis minor]
MMTKLWIGAHESDHCVTQNNSSWAQQSKLSVPLPTEASNCPGIAHYTSENVDPCLCAHIIYAFAGMANNQINWNDEALYASINGILEAKDYVMNYWKNQGALAEKLLVGCGVYAHTIALINPANCCLDAPTSGLGTARPYTQEAETLAYFEIMLQSVHVYPGHQLGPHCHCSSWGGSAGDSGFCARSPRVSNPATPASAPSTTTWMGTPMRRLVRQAWSLTPAALAVTGLKVHWGL